MRYLQSFVRSWVEIEKEEEEVEGGGLSFRGFYCYLVTSISELLAVLLNLSSTGIQTEAVK